ncbi:hypothetical protein DWG18_11120 [Lysobacter sp. TY2-98]|uniref:hypothetical protein n=1 Tax=Lysobacter sp. TY2-98 TaxID=2290922 RepID=UPI000E207F15|nr:hypothetical protein [Lysobacter sp. TY2-98]AXK72774.1 hypothetical protein DWG18_11120 [Lysobacter sp. TY2-98]
MAMVFWAHVAFDGALHCEGADRLALYRHRHALDALAQRLGLPRLDAMVDTTDLRFNFGELDVPDDDPNAAMLVNGVWCDAERALLLFEGLDAALDGEATLDAKARLAVREELQGVLDFLRPRAIDGARFNLAVVM